VWNDPVVGSSCWIAHSLPVTDLASLSQLLLLASEHWWCWGVRLAGSCACAGGSPPSPPLSPPPWERGVGYGYGDARLLASLALTSCKHVYGAAAGTGGVCLLPGGREGGQTDTRGGKSSRHHVMGCDVLVGGERAGGRVSSGLPGGRRRAREGNLALPR